MREGAVIILQLFTLEGRCSLSLIASSSLSLQGRVASVYLRSLELQEFPLCPGGMEQEPALGAAGKKMGAVGEEEKKSNLEKRKKKTKNKNKERTQQEFLT